MPYLDELSADRQLLDGYPWPERKLLRWWVWAQISGGAIGRSPARARRMLSLPLARAEAAGVASFEIGLAVLCALFGSLVGPWWLHVVLWVLGVLLLVRGAVVLRTKSADRDVHLTPGRNAPPSSAPSSPDDYQVGPAWEAKAAEVEHRDGQ